MGCDCHNYLPSKVRSKEVEELLMLLGYEKLGRKNVNKSTVSSFYFMKDEDYKYTDGVYAEIRLSSKGSIEVWTHTNIWRSKYDSEYHNYTIRHIRKFLGGYFISDNGKNRYLDCDKPKIDKSEGGCYIAFSSFHQNIKRIKWFAKNYVVEGKFPNNDKSEEFRKLREHNPEIFEMLREHDPEFIGSNLVIPFIISIIEEYFRSTYIALLKYSPNREQIVKNVRVSDPELNTMLLKGDSIEEIFAHGLSFQNINKICGHYSKLNNKLDIHAVLKKPYYRRKESLFHTIERLISQRHEIIHNAKIDIRYGNDNLKKDLNSVQIAIIRVYKFLIKIHKWYPYHPDL